MCSAFREPSTYTNFSFRPITPGMGQAVAERTILRRKISGELENWGDVAQRVALGNSLLHQSGHADFAALRDHIALGHTVMSGRHLQHGDVDQAHRNMEVFTNCSTSPATFLLFYLLLNGSGVGRCYDDDMMLVNWDYAPAIRCVLDQSHPDYQYDIHESRRDALHKFGEGDENNSKNNVVWHEVADSREGWAKALEIWEVMAFERIHSHKMLILDFSSVRCKGQPIGGMQNRPASGPVPLMAAFMHAASLKGSGMAPWLQAMYIDHYFAECVLVGGARRAARMSTKHWTDKSIFNFIQIKRPIEYIGKSVDEVVAMRKNARALPFLWSSNNSVTVDEEFWACLRDPTVLDKETNDHAHQVFNTITACAYGDGTGEPGIINSHLLVQNDMGWADLNRGDYVDSAKYHVEDDTSILLSKLAKRAKRKKYHTIVNPCGEIPLNVLGGFCVIADVVPYHCETIEEAKDCFRQVTRALIRVNLMNSIYAKEVSRTNRIGVGITGIHEFAWKFFGCGFRDLIEVADSDFGALSALKFMGGEFYPELLAASAAPIRAAAFWMTLREFNKIVHDESISYSKELGVVAPHTQTTVKPSGSVSKLFALTEGWHLPSMREFLRWVQFRSDDPLVQVYAAAGYPVRVLTSYSGTTIVGFPTAPAITTLGMGDKLITAVEATPEEQFRWLQLGEKFWIEGTDEKHPYGGQISYTLKYNPTVVSFAEFRKMVLADQAYVRCCSVMPQEDASAYEYQPEEPVTKEQFDAYVAKIVAQTEDIGREHLDCASGACPVDFSTEKV